jgi:hypothetical protein
MRFIYTRGDFVSHIINTIRENNMVKSHLWEKIYEEFKSEKKDEKSDEST